MIVNQVINANMHFILMFDINWIENLLFHRDANAEILKKINGFLLAFEFHGIKDPKP